MRMFPGILLRKKQEMGKARGGGEHAWLDITKFSLSIFSSLRKVEESTGRSSHVAVPGRYRPLFRCLFRSHYCAQSAVAQNVHKGGWGLW